MAPCNYNMMTHYQYVGTDPFLIGQTALGQIVDDIFVVQVDDLNHSWSRHWHATPQEDWKENE